MKKIQEIFTFMMHYLGMIFLGCVEASLITSYASKVEMEVVALQVILGVTLFLVSVDIKNERLQDIVLWCAIYCWVSLVVILPLLMMVQ